MGDHHPRIDRVVLIRQEDDSECLLRDERDVGSETVRRTSLVDQNVLLGGDGGSISIAGLAS